MSRTSFRRGILAALLSLFFLTVAFAMPREDAQKPLQVYFVDVEGGQATLFVTPEGQSLLVDTGWPGDVLPIHGMRVRVVSSDGALIDKPLPGAGAENAACKSSEQRPADQTENPRSLGTLITFGKLKLLDLGDLTWDKEMELMSPRNKLGKIDIYIVSHHGWLQRSSPELVYGIDPRVAIMDNGAKKGGTPSAWEIIKASPHLEDLWQLHFSEEGGPAHNTPEPFIANLSGPQDAANYLKLTALADGSFDVFNARTNTAKHYAASH